MEKCQTAIHRIEYDEFETHERYIPVTTEQKFEKRNMCYICSIIEIELIIKGKSLQVAESEMLTKIKNKIITPNQKES